MENPKKVVPTLISIILISFLSVSLAFSLLMKSITIQNYGKISKYVFFDKCDLINDWQIYNARDSQAPGYNTIEVDTTDKVEGTGSLKGTFAADAPNYGGAFYKSNGTFWNIINTPVLRMWMKINQSMYSAFRLEIVCDYAWYVFGYEILNKLTVGEWCELTIDLRLPDYKPAGRIPDLTKVHRLSLTYWYGYPLEQPQVIWWDNITLWAGPYIPPQIEVTPLSKTVMTNEVVSFSIRTLGGEEPYSYTWWVNGSLQQGQTLSTFNFSTSIAGKYNVTATVTDNRGNTNSATAWVTVLNEPPEQPPIPQSLDTFKSEIRGVFLALWWDDPNRNWTKVAETCFNYGISTVVLETYLMHFWQNGHVVDFPELRTAIEAFHDKGLSVHICLDLGLTPPDPSMYAVRGADLHTVSWLCFTKNATRQMLKAVAESLARDYDLDGFMFDYIRYDFGGEDMCLCDECKAKFIADTGLSDVDWPRDVLSGGRYYWQFIEWRMKPIDETVRDMGKWIKAINPNITLSAAVFTAFENCGNWFPMRIGQHVAEWVDQGYIDMVCPMLYSPDPLLNGDYLTNSLNFYTAGPEGKIPMVPFITDWNLDIGQPIPVEDFIETVRQMKQRGADGWIVWAYWGPGLYEGKYADIRPYLATLFEEGLMEPIWAIQKFEVITNSTHAIISWTTTVPTTGVIEYSDYKIFNGSIKYGEFDRLFHYKDIDYLGGIVAVNATLSISHTFIIPITIGTQFRIQSMSENGIILTSQPYSIHVFGD